MEYPPFKTLAFTHEGAVYAGRWRATAHSVTVRYKRLEVCKPAARADHETIAKALIIEMTQAERAHAADAERRASGPVDPIDLFRAERGSM